MIKFIVPIVAAGLLFGVGNGAIPTQVRNVSAPRVLDKRVKPVPLGPEKIARAEEAGLNITSKSGFLMCRDSGQVFFEKDADKKMPVASVVKIMTMLLAHEAEARGELDFDEKVTASEFAAGMGGSQVFLDAGFDYAVSDLLTSISIASGNDASVLIAERLAGSEAAYVFKMNQRAKELGMFNTNFSNCTGLPEANGYSTARDMSIAMKELTKYPKYFETAGIWMTDIKHQKDGRVTGLSNTNKLSRFYQGCDGGKTGFTQEAGSCLIATAKRGDLRLVGGVIGGVDSKTRFKEVSDLFNYGFNSFVAKTLIRETDEFAVEIIGAKGVVKASPKFGYSNIAKKGETKDQRVETRFERLQAPMEKGDVVGKAVIMENDAVVYEIDLVLKDDVLEKTYLDYLDDIVSKM
ncbi:MAG: D-alanyl-D-alanine carboxypeptidase [Firmicutes bacterium]|nr:D-alanyl-D-alanine carboxypeptidase [Bacillota bacterium]MCL2771476.1 D-alanyl-D-alanine carboxypeptidase [Bacillota bacterium]